MATHYHIQETQTGLRIYVRHQSVWWEQVLAAGIAGAAVWLACVTFLNGRWKLVSSVLVAVLSFVAAIRPKRATLTITNVEFLTQGNFTRRFHSGQTVCTGDVRWLEYQESSASEDSPYEAGGLYAVMNRGKACLLPFLTEAQTIQVIAEIEKKFPGLAERWRAESPFTSHFLTLGLTKAG
jgi:hypothetical protein